MTPGNGINIRGLGNWHIFKTGALSPHLIPFCNLSSSQWARQDSLNDCLIHLTAAVTRKKGGKTQSIAVFA